MSSPTGDYDFAAFEAKWQKYWREHKTFRTPQPQDSDFDASKPKFYVLDMFPYPSGAGLHVGHPLGYIATDIYARHLRMRGYNVLHPMGYDAFGLPAEQYAIEHGVPPRETTEDNVDNMRSQLQRLGMGYDWDREIATTDVGYYKWTQWIFLQMFNSWYDPGHDTARPISELIHKFEQDTQTWAELTPEQRREVLDDHRLAYVDEVPVNWCPALGTVLANEEVTNEGRSDRGNHPVYRRPLRQWMLRITRYADRLLQDLDRLDWPESIKVMQRNWIGRSEGAEVDFPVNYKLQDWLFSRQRYWGEPFPIVHDPKTGDVFALDESELPVELPEIEDYRPQASDDPDAPPAPPLGRAKEWAHVRGYVTESGSVKLVRPGEVAPPDAQVRDFGRELNTMPQWAGSCWYYLRYLDNHNDQALVDPEINEYWMAPRDGGVDLYVGGAEHAVLHLLYARFWHKVLYDLGHVSSPEPFGRLFNQGYIQAYAYQDDRGMYMDANDVEQRGEGKDVQFVQRSTGKRLTRSLGKMGKSLKNAVAPDEICRGHGTDALRAYEMYMGPLEASKPWNTRDIIGMSRFLQAMWRRFVAEDGTLRVSDSPADDSLRRLLHKTIKKVTADMEGLRFNTAIAAMIELNNALKGDRIPREVAEPLIQMLSPIAPHLCEELWQRLQGEKWHRSIAHESWPTYDEALCTETQIEIPVQIGGKVRSRITLPADAAASEESMKTAALADERIQKALAGKTVRRVICIPGRMVNIVAN